MKRRNYQAVPVDAELLSQPDDAVRRFEDAGGHLTHFSNFRKDLLEGRPHLIAERERVFHERFPDFGPFFHNLLNGGSSLFRDGLTYFTAITVRLHSTI